MGAMGPGAGRTALHSVQVLRFSLGPRMADGSEGEAIEWSFDVVLPREIDTKELLKLVAWARAPLCGAEGEATSVEVEEGDGQVTVVVGRDDGEPIGAEDEVLTDESVLFELFND
jgi:hypothetical protein